MPVATLIKKRTIQSLTGLEGKRVLVRVDYNVPLDKQTGQVTDENRLQASLPTVEYLLQKKAKVILISHLGRPKGQVNPKYSLKPVVDPLSALLKTKVHFAEDCIGPRAKEAVAALKAGEVLLLENLRFHPEEEANSSEFGRELASLADFFVEDAFGSVHRAHASTAQVPSLLPSAAGFLLDKELTFLQKVKSDPTRPYMVILGGAKVSDKLGVVNAMVAQANTVFIGGAMAYTFLKAQGHDVGDSLFEADQIDLAKQILATAKAKNVAFLLPVDHKVVENIEKPAVVKTTDGMNISKGWKGVDIGPKTLAALKPKIQESKCFFWNGPSGIFEVKEFAQGTMEIATLLAESARKGATVVVGGGDSVAAVNKAGLSKDMTFISTGGGASLEFLEGQELPGVSALPNG